MYLLSIGRRMLKQVVVFTVLVLLTNGCASDQADVQSEASANAAIETYEAIGVVKTITSRKDYINIDHEEITGFMGAMAMFFPVPDTSVLGNVAVDDSVRFTIAVKAGKPAISEIEVIH